MGQSIPPTDANRKADGVHPTIFTLPHAGHSFPSPRAHGSLDYSCPFCKSFYTRAHVHGPALGLYRLLIIKQWGVRLLPFGNASDDVPGRLLRYLSQWDLVLAKVIRAAIIAYMMRFLGNPRPFSWSQNLIEKCDPHQKDPFPSVACLIFHSFILWWFWNEGRADRMLIGCFRKWF